MKVVFLQKKRNNSKTEDLKKYQFKTFKQKMTDLNEHDKERLVREAVFHVLTLETKRPVFTKGNVMKVIEMTSSPATVQIEIWNRVVEELKDTFGFAMKENDEKKGTNSVLLHLFCINFMLLLNF